MPRATRSIAPRATQTQWCLTPRSLGCTKCPPDWEPGLPSVASVLTDCKPDETSAHSARMKTSGNDVPADASGCVSPDWSTCPLVCVPGGVRPRRRATAPMLVPAGVPSPRCCVRLVPFLALSLFLPPLRRLSLISVDTSPFQDPPLWRSSLPTPSPLGALSAGTGPCLRPAPLVPLPVCAPHW